MAKSWSRWRLSRHALVSALVLCVFAWQTLLAAPSPHFLQLADADVETSVAAAVGAHCDGRGGERSPAPAGHDHSGCCVFCAACGRDGPQPLALAEPATARTMSPSRSSVSLVYDFADGPSLRPIGWTSSWSSRAPPAA